MIDKLKDLLGIAKPGGVDDVVVRAIKTGVAVLLASPFVDALPRVDLDAAQAALFAAATAAATVLINATIAAISGWASK